MGWRVVNSAIGPGWRLRVLAQLKEFVENKHNVAALHRVGTSCVYVLIDNCVCLFVACGLRIKYFDRC